jgi:hypothetical protein
MEQNGLSIKFDFNGDKERETRLAPYSSAVANEFSFPDKKIYVYIANWDDPEFSDERSPKCRGKYFRGFHVPPQDMGELPDYLRRCVFHPLSATPVIDHLVYIRNSTSIDRLPFVLTLAHELQHVTQYCSLRRILSANSLLHNHLARSIDPDTTLTPIDLPHEQDANIVSKRVAGKILEKESIDKYAEEQIERFRNHSGDRNARAEFIRWNFFFKCDASQAFDLTAKTIPFFEQFRSRINPQLARGYGLDILKDQWWA